MSIVIRYDWHLRKNDKDIGVEFYSGQSNGLHTWERNIKKATFFTTLEEAQTIGNNFARYEFINIEYLDADSNEVLAYGNPKSVHTEAASEGRDDGVTTDVEARTVD